MSSHFLVSDMLQKTKLQRPLRIAINGFGRIGRAVMRVIADTPEFRDGQLVVTTINDLTDAKTLGHLLSFDSVHGRFATPVSVADNSITVGGQKIAITAIPNPEQLPWAASKVDIVLECTGRLKDREATAAHLKAGAKKVIFSAPLKDADLTVVMGINHESYDSERHAIVSNASCTTNCLAPVAKVLEEQFKIVRGSMTTIHSYTNDQRILDLPHSDLRRARAAALSMIPTTTGAAKAIGLVLPSLKGKLDGISVRVPTPNVSLVDFVCEVEKDTSRDEVNLALKKASETSLKGILGFEEQELVSSDFNGVALSSIIDAPYTNVIEKRLVKVLSWYDNEWGFSNRMVDLTLFMGQKIS